MSAALATRSRTRLKSPRLRDDADVVFSDWFPFAIHTVEIARRQCAQVGEMPTRPVSDGIGFWKGQGE